MKKQSKLHFFCITRERKWISTFIETSTQHPLKDHKASGVIIHNQYPETRRELVGDGVSCFQRRTRSGSLAVAEIHGWFWRSKTVHNNKHSTHTTTSHGWNWHHGSEKHKNNKRVSYLWSSGEETEKRVMEFIFGCR